MANLAIRKIPGIGRMTELILNNLEIHKCKDVIDKAADIFIAFREAAAQSLISNSLGIARYRHEEGDEDAIQKSISTSSTFKPVATYEQFKCKIIELCENLAEQMDRRKIGGLNLTLNMKSTKFEI